MLKQESFVDPIVNFICSSLLGFATLNLITQGFSENFGFAQMEVTRLQICLLFPATRLEQAQRHFDPWKQGYVLLICMAGAR